MSDKAKIVRVETSYGAAVADLGIALSPTDTIAIERGAVVVRHGKRHRVVARVALPPAVKVEV